MTGHIVLLGDSMLDNAKYVAKGQSVAELLRGLVSEDWRVTLKAVSGAVVNDVMEKQLVQIPDDTSHIVLSVGGNNALQWAREWFEKPTETIGSAVRALCSPVGGFTSQYEALVRQMLLRKTPVIVCTIYDSVPDFDPAELLGLSFFNDTITRIALRNELPLIDLRSLCDERTDYCSQSPIEPSEKGGHKIASAINDAVRNQMPCSATQ